MKSDQSYKLRPTLWDQRNLTNLDQPYEIRQILGNQACWRTDTASLLFFGKDCEKKLHFGDSKSEFGTKNLPIGIGTLRQIM
jgi:hypothetical protein